MLDTDLQTFLQIVWAELRQPAVLVQLMVIAACVLVGFGLERRWEQGMLERSKRDQHRALEIGRQGLAHALFPLATLVLLVVSKVLLKGIYSVKLIQVAISLMGAMAMVRVGLFALRHAFPASSSLLLFEKSLSISIWSVLALDIVGWLPPILDALDNLVISFGKQEVSLLMLMEGFLILSVGQVLALWLGNTVEGYLRQAGDLDANLRLILGRVARTLFLLIALLISLPMVGIDLTTLSVVGGALGVGLGFGLQKIAANYVSGFIILLDRSIRIGNMIKVGDDHGVVTQITTRFTVLHKTTGQEVIVPNETLVNSVVVNETYSHSNLRLDQRIQIAYHSDLELALKLLVDSALQHERVQQDPIPEAYLESFGDFGLNLMLIYWITEPQRSTLDVRSDINREIFRQFQQHQIEIPYPRQEIAVLPRATPIN